VARARGTVLSAVAQEEAGDAEASTSAPTAQPAKPLSSAAAVSGKLPTHKSFIISLRRSAKLTAASAPVSAAAGDVGDADDADAGGVRALATPAVRHTLATATLINVVLFLAGAPHRKGIQCRHQPHSRIWQGRPCHQGRHLEVSCNTPMLAFFILECLLTVVQLRSRA
jgi:hypothetical protein